MDPEKLEAVGAAIEEDAARLILYRERRVLYMTLARELWELTRKTDPVWWGITGHTGMGEEYVQCATCLEMGDGVENVRHASYCLPGRVDAALAALATPPARDRG